jgi:hypothetical protein
MRGVFENDPPALIDLGKNGGALRLLPWPKPVDEYLRRALHNSMQMGLIPADCREVELPDGSVFTIDS